ncbi:hypothetical protein EC973_003134 [Apophysomyces ossiformis]|uniref:Alkaline phosphatase n=1 Tax=Apophysomyces ossiformis TaxID=679940 RepID=A0A8H7BHG2_9FUNG|nr:hypothetical protein EC973_003134 [Apophysomyces ossiformis]
MREPLLGNDEWSENRVENSTDDLKRRRPLLAALALSLTVAGFVTAFLSSKPWVEKKEISTAFDSSVKPVQNVRNVIMMISDGLGPASVSFARTYSQFLYNHPYDHVLPLDSLHIGQSRTRSASTLVTDSAAGATAFSCGLKTENRAVGVDPKGQPCGTVLESAKLHHGMKTGLVATSRITHATPASFSAHVKDRDNEDSIAAQQLGDNPLGRVVDLMFGGGVCHFLPKADGGCRADKRNLLQEAKEKYGWSILRNRTEFDALSNDSKLPLMGLFSSGHMDYEIDRVAETQPSLTEMSTKALHILSAATNSTDKGFFLMIEGSRIDMAAHSNDAAAHLHDILEYQNTVALVKEFVDNNPGTIMISTSDHETGGLSLARQVSNTYPRYLWYPDVLTKVKQSTVGLATHILKNKLPSSDVQILLKERLGIDDPTEKEISAMASKKSVKSLDQYLAEMVSLRAQLGWATHGHSAVDVNLYAYGEGVDSLRGSHENIEIGHFIEKVLDLNLTDITTQLNKDNPHFQLSTLTDKTKLIYNDVLDEYHHKPENLHHPSYE